MSPKGSEPDWVGLREAAADAGVSVSVLRKWYRTGQIGSRLDPGLYGPQRMVRLTEVRERASRIAPAPAGREASPRELDLTWLLHRWAEAERRAARAERELELLRAGGLRPGRRGLLRR